MVLPSSSSAVVGSSHVLKVCAGNSPRALSKMRVQTSVAVSAIISMWKSQGDAKVGRVKKEVNESSSREKSLHIQTLKVG
jgi:hypothetical protein